MKDRSDLQQLDSDDFLAVMTSNFSNLLDNLVRLDPKSPLLADAGIVLAEGRARMKKKLLEEKEIVRVLSLNLILLEARKKSLISNPNKNSEISTGSDRDALWYRLNRALEQYRSHLKEKSDTALDFSAIENLINELTPWISPQGDKNPPDVGYASDALEQFFPENLPTLDYDCNDMYELVRRMAELKGEEPSDAGENGVIVFANITLADDNEFPVPEEKLRKPVHLKYQPLTENFSVSFMTDDLVYLSNHYFGQGSPGVRLGLNSRNSDVAKKIEEAIDFSKFYTAEELIPVLANLMDTADESMIKKVIQGTMLDSEASNSHFQSRPWYQFQWSPGKKRINLIRKPTAAATGLSILSIRVDQKELNLCQTD